MQTFNIKSYGFAVLAGNRGLGAVVGICPWPVLGAVALPVFLGFFEPGIISLVWKCFYWAAFFTVPIVIFGIVYTWGRSDESIISVVGKFIRPVPFGLVYGSDLKPAGVPIVTISLIIANTALFYITPIEIVDQLCFLPYGDLNLLHVILTTVTCAFFHGDTSHLFGNMVFLWAFGATLEARIGWARFITAYLLCSVLSSLICLNLLIYQIQVYDDPLLILQYGSIGASGAIAGLMGLFVVRCHFAKLSFSLPILFNPLFSYPLRINGILLIGLFFAGDLAGSVVQMHYDDVMIDYWGHVGGFLGGLMLALIFNLQTAGKSEAQEVKAERLSQTVGGTEEASELYTDMLAKDPNNLTALRHFLKLNRYNDAKEGFYFKKLVLALVRKDFQSAVRQVRDYYPKHLNLLPGEVQFRIGVEFYQSADFEKARLCLELAAGKDGSWQCKAKLILSRIYETLGNVDRARSILLDLLDRKPEDIFRRQAKQRLIDI